MKSEQPENPTTKPEATRTPLTNLVDHKLNKPLAEEIADELHKEDKEPARSGANDYAHGTTEHDDDRET